MPCVLYSDYRYDRQRFHNLRTTPDILFAAVSAGSPRPRRILPSVRSARLEMNIHPSNAPTRCPSLRDLSRTAVLTRAEPLCTGGRRFDGTRCRRSHDRRDRGRRAGSPRCAAAGVLLSAQGTQHMRDLRIAFVGRVLLIDLRRGPICILSRIMLWYMLPIFVIRSV